jgi:hypothetical protein
LNAEVLAQLAGQALGDASGTAVSDYFGFVHLVFLRPVALF